MLNQISTGSAPRFDYHSRRDAGISAYDSALTGGIKASRSRFIKRTDAESANAASEQKAPSPVSAAGIAAAKMLAAAKAEASDGKENLRSGRDVNIYVYLADTIETPPAYTKELLAGIAAAKKTLAAAPKADTVEISDEGRELAAQMSESNREKGLELVAKYFAENAIDDPAVKQSFLDNVNEVAKNAELMGKGFFVVMTMDGGGRSVTNIDDNLLAMKGKLTEKAAADIINRVKSSLDMNTVKEDARNTLKKIIADYTNLHPSEAVPRHKSDDS